jgi:non-ribosomal peptide synthetase component F
MKQLIKELTSKGIYLSVKNEKLVCKVENKQNFTDEIKNTLKNNKQELIDFLSFNVNYENSSLSKEEVEELKIEYKNLKKVYSATSLQEGMLILDSINLENSNYNLQMFCDFPLSYNIDKLKESWNITINKYDILKTAFINKKGIYEQVVVSEVSKDWNYLDLSDFNGDIENKIEELHYEKRIKHFDYSEPCLMDLSLIKTPNNKYHFIWTFNHSILDGMSMSKLLTEVLTNYKLLINNNVIENNKEIPFENYINYLKNKNTEKSKEYWTEYLEGFKSTNEIELFNSESDSLISDNIEESFSVDTFVVEKLKNLAKDNKTTLANVVQMVWGITVSQLSYSDDIVFGSTVSVRPTDLLKVNDIIGLFINTIPVRFSYNNDTISQVLKKLKNDSLDRQEHSYLSLIDISNSSEISNNEALFESLLVFQDVGGNIENEEMEFLDIENQGSFGQTNYKITILVEEKNTGELSFIIKSHSNFTDSEALNKLSILLNNILKSVSESDSNNKLYDVDIFNNDNSLKSILTSEKKCITEQNITDLINFDSEELAFKLEEEEITYKELNSKIEEKIKKLSEKGIKQGHRVAVNLGRSLEQMITMLSLMKMNAIYTPIVEDNAHFVDVLSKEFSFEINSVEIKEINKNKIFSDDIAYTLFTSGTTGEPKALNINHKTFINLLISQEDELKEKLKTLQFSSYSFDVSLQEIFTTLTTNSTCYILTEEQRHSFEDIVELIKEEEIERMFMPFSVLESLVYSLEDPEELCGLKLIVTAGEQLKSTESLRDFFLENEETKLLNHYGPAETHVVTSLELDEDSDEWEDLPSIGRPILNTNIYILNEKTLKPVPVGALGEIFISGLCSSNSYTKKELNEQSYFQDILNSKEKMYKTGDIGRALNNGEVKYIGRNDNQVKINGIRIDLGLIESTILSETDISNVSVIIENKILKAYAVSDFKLDINKLKNQLRESLPSRLIPIDWYQIKNIPFNKNGKINKEELIQNNKEKLKKNVELPTNETEEKLLQIWKDIILVEDIYIKDNFFDIGGNSLSIMIMKSKIKNVFNVEIKENVLFENSTIQSIAKIINE